jgi:ABC-2 type transport system permease protein
VSPSTAASWTSTNGWLAAQPRVAAASLKLKAIDRRRQIGAIGYLLLFVVSPLFGLATAALIYAPTRPDLVSYVVVGMAAQTLISSAIYNVGEILDRERMAGTLVPLFLAPCARGSWLLGFAAGAVFEAGLVSAGLLLLGHFGFGVQFDPDWPALALTLGLFVAALGGMGFVFSAIGLALKKANPFSNLVSPFLMLLGGAFFPVSQLPDWLRYPARLLPLGYATQALASAALDHKGVPDLLPELLPLAGFALLLPIAGVLAFRWIERLIRRRGELDIY